MNNNSKENRKYTCNELTRELNEERKKNGEYLIQETTSAGIGGSTGTYARKDKTFSNAFDFFIKLVRREKNNR